jgi:hypothetical protein
MARGSLREVSGTVRRKGGPQHEAEHAAPGGNPVPHTSPERYLTVAGVVLGPLATLATAKAASAQPRAWEGWDMHPMWGMWGLWGIGMMLGMLVFWGLVITGVVLGIRWLVRQARRSARGTAPSISCGSVTPAARSTARNSWRASATCEDGSPRSALARLRREALAVASSRGEPDTETR